MSELEADRLEGAPHPRETLTLYGQPRAEAEVLAALAAGRFHHAWLLGGPEGVGKATFAYRLAKRMLAGVLPGKPITSLDLPPDDPTARKVVAQSHPDLTILRRVPRKDGKALTSNIPVDQVRRALDVFTSTSGAGGWRICIIDSADDLDRAGANALLKMIEEPPRNALFLIVSHAPQRLLPTIRSRCRKLSFEALSEPDLKAALLQTGLASAGDPAVMRAVSLAEGSVRKALMRLNPETLALIEAVQGRLDSLPNLDIKALLALAEDVGRRGQDEDLAIVMETVGDWLGVAIRRLAAQGAVAAAPLALAWTSAQQRAREAETYNLDKRPLILSLFRDLATAMTGKMA